ncbi:MAG: hypothetical protein JWL85_84, partial [Candidatus Saccharibacteria bacterium]|nr:hypothetical protein [Candidatus Saccharibacteria bacterium]
MYKKILLATLVGLAFTLFGWATVGHAQEFRTGDRASIGVQETIDSSAYVSGRTIDIGGAVNGDLFCAGQNVTISGTVRGDVICAAQTVTITGTVEGDVRVAAQTVVISSTVQRNVTVAAQTLTVDAKGSIGGDVMGGVQDATINGPVGRDLTIGGSEITINTPVGRNIKTSVEYLHLRDGAKVGGNVDYKSINEIDRAPGATVAGNVHRSESAPEHQGSHFGAWLLSAVYWLLSMLLLSLVLVILLPSMFERAAANNLKTPWKTLLFGFLTILVTPIVGVMLLLTFIGLPLAILLFLLWIVVLMLSIPFSSYYLGRLVWKAQRNPILVMLLGALILLIVSNIPFIGGFVVFVAVVLGTGMVVRELVS